MVARIGWGHDTRLRHLAFMALCRMQHQPPTIYVPPADNDEEYDDEEYDGLAAGGAAPVVRLPLPLGGAKSGPALDAGGSQLDVADEAALEDAGVVEQAPLPGPHTSPAAPSPPAPAAAADGASPAAAAPPRHKVKLTLKVKTQDAPQ